MAGDDWREARKKYMVSSQKREPEVGKAPEPQDVGGRRDSVLPPKQSDRVQASPASSIQGGGAGKAIAVATVLLVGLIALIVLVVHSMNGGESGGSPLPVIIAVAAIMLLGGIVLIALLVRAMKGGENVMSHIDGDAAVVGRGAVVVDSARQLQSVVDKRQHAVGLVMFCAKLRNGTAVAEPIGTAWACASDKFATNAHVADALRTMSHELLLNLGQGVILGEIGDELFQKGGAGEDMSSEQKQLAAQRILEAYKEKIGEEAFVEKLEAAVNLVVENLDKFVKEMEVEIRINGKQNVSVPVTKVQVHRKYGMSDTKFNPDVALLTVGSKVNDCFPVANRNSLKSMKQGMPIAFLGFPMENLTAGNVNCEAPVATMQTGIVSALSDFEMKDVGFEGNYLIRHNLPSTGGASGSPIFNTDGEVVALLHAGNIDIKFMLDESQEKAVFMRSPHAAQVNFGVRVDLLEGVGEPVPLRKWLLED